MFWQRKRREQDLERELQSDLQLEAEEQQENGLSAQEARYAARRAFGNVTLIKEETHEMWNWARAERLAQDIRYTSRLLRKNPGFAAIRKTVSFGSLTLKLMSSLARHLSLLP